MKRYVIIGSGPAGATAAETVKKLDKESKITVVTDEGYPFYKREHIAGLISGEETEEGLFEKGRDFYEKIGADFVNGHVVQVLPEKNHLILDDASDIHYDFLLIASGGKPIRPAWPGVQLEGISTLYTLDDAKKVAKLVEEAERVVVIGAGTIAMKVVPLLRKKGLKVSLVEKADRLWPTMFDKRASEVLEHRFKENDVEILLKEEVSEFEGENGKVQTVFLKSKRTLPCDLVLLAIGISLSTDFMKESGIKLDRGVLVDQHLRTSTSNVYAAGDVAQVPDPLFQAPMLHPNWGYAEEQGHIAACNMAGLEKQYEGAVSLNTMDVYDLGIVAVGNTQPQGSFEELSRFSLREGTYRKFILEENRLVGALLIGKGLNRKLLKPLVQKAVLKMVNVNTVKTDLLREEVDFNSILAHV